MKYGYSSIVSQIAVFVNGLGWFLMGFVFLRAKVTGK